MKITAVIPAHNEEDVIAHTITNLRAANPDSIIVIADGCTDSTAQLAEASGAVVFQRHALQTSEVSQTSEVLGKGAALKWLFASDRVGLEDRRGLVVIFDADSTVSPNFFAEVRRAFENGAQATQSFVSPVLQPPSVPPLSPLTEDSFKNPPAKMGGSPSGQRGKIVAPTLAAYSEVLSQVFDDEVRARLGWSVPLRGTGMAFRVGLLRELLPHIHTRTEDIELSLLLAQRGVRVKFLRDAIVYDPKPHDAERVARQRARWLQGQMQVWQSYWKMMLPLCLRGAEMGWLLSALLLKPKALFVFLKFVALASGMLLPIPLWLKSFLAFFFAAEIFYYTFGLLLVSPQDRSRYASALFFSPFYIFIWAGSLLTAMRERNGWLSVRH